MLSMLFVSFLVWGDQAADAYSAIGRTRPTKALSLTLSLHEDKDLCRTPKTLFAFFLTASHCLAQLSELVMYTPRYFWNLTPSRMDLHREYVNSDGSFFRVTDSV